MTGLANGRSEELIGNLDKSFYLVIFGFGRH